MIRDHVISKQFYVKILKPTQVISNFNCYLTIIKIRSLNLFTITKVFVKKKS